MFLKRKDIFNNLDKNLKNEKFILVDIKELNNEYKYLVVCLEKSTSINIGQINGRFINLKNVFDVYEKY